MGHAMQDRMNDLTGDRATLYGLTAFYVSLPFVALMVFPTYAPLVILLAIASLLSVWRYDLADLDRLGLRMAHDPAPPVGLAAFLVRLRLAIFGATTSFGLIWLVMPLAGVLQGPEATVFLGAIVFAGIPAALLSTHATLFILATWRAFSGILLDAANIGIAVMLAGRVRQDSHQKIYDDENAFFVRLAGYQSSLMFTSSARRLRSGLPKIRG